MARLFAHRPEVVTAAADLGEQCAFGLALIAPQLPPFDVPAGHTEDSWLRHLVMAGARNRYGAPERAPRAYAQIEHELESHCAAAVSGLLPGGARHHPVLPGEQHPGPGQGIGGQLGGLLRARCHQRRPDRQRAAVRAVPIPGTGRAAGYRHRHRIGPAGEGHPVRLRPLRPRLRRPGRQRHHLPRPQRGARHGPRAGVLPGPAGRVEQADRPVERAWPTHPTSRTSRNR